MSNAIKEREEIDRRMALPYTKELRRNGDGTWFARVVEFPGCMTEGDTQAEAIVNLDDAMRAWIAVQVEDGDSIPEPLDPEGFSGKFMVRLPKTLHRDLVRKAEMENVSLNQYVTIALAKASV